MCFGVVCSPIRDIERSTSEVEFSKNVSCEPNVFHILVPIQCPMEQGTLQWEEHKPKTTMTLTTRDCLDLSPNERTFQNKRNQTWEVVLQTFP